MLSTVRQAILATLIASLPVQFLHAADPVVCDHSYFGLPHGLFSTEWNIPKEAMESLLKQSRLPPTDEKQYFACPNTFAALTFTQKDGFRFVVLPHTWTDFRPIRVSRIEIDKRVMNLSEIEALLDTPSVAMGSVTVRITAYAGHGISGGPLPPDNKPSTTDGG
jgi:hypothetical protein